LAGLAGAKLAQLLERKCTPHVLAEDSSRSRGRGWPCCYRTVPSLTITGTTFVNVTVPVSICVMAG
jgi:hypothetical protein